MSFQDLIPAALSFGRAARIITPLIIGLFLLNKAIATAEVHIAAE
jgi:hypothetical protein